MLLTDYRALLTHGNAGNAGMANHEYQLISGLSMDATCTSAFRSGRYMGSYTKESYTNASLQVDTPTCALANVPLLNVSWLFLFLC